jgi:hypothetical protein
MLNLLGGKYLNSGLFLNGWPWLPAIQEYAGLVDESETWHVPSRWRDFFMEYENRSDAPDFGFGDMSWVEEFK